MILTLLVSITCGAFGLAQEPTARELARATDHFRAGMQALASERWDRAEVEFRAAVKLDPLYDAAFYGLGQVFMVKREYEDAVRAYTDSRAAFKAGAAARSTNKITTDRRTRDQIQAIQEYIRSLERAASRGNPNLVADLQQQRLRIRQLEGQLTLSVSSQPEVPAGLSLALGSAYFRLAAYADAEREYLEAVRVDPDFGEAHNNLAVLFMMSGRFAQAEQEIALAERVGFKVSANLKADLKKRKGGTGRQLTW